MRGPKPKPTHLKVVSGNPGKRPLNKREPKPIGNLLSPPDWMSESQCKVWRQAIDFAPDGLLKNLDESILTIWVVAKDYHRQASQAVDQFGMLTNSPNTGELIQTPYLAVVNKQAQIMMKAAAEMGFTPSSRSRITLDNPVPKDEWTDF